jgi:hypothetical protein
MNINEYYTLAWSVNEFHYGIYAYTECKTQTIYMHNTGLNTSKQWQTHQGFFFSRQWVLQTIAREYDHSPKLIVTRLI